MNALQASERLERLNRRLKALYNVINRLDGDRDFSDDLDEIVLIRDATEREIAHLSERLSEVRI